MRVCRTRSDTDSLFQGAQKSPGPHMTPGFFIHNGYLSSPLSASKLNDAELMQ